MAEIVNLRTERKRRARADEARRADANRVSHGLTKREKARLAADRAREAARLGAHRRGLAPDRDEP